MNRLLPILLFTWGTLFSLKNNAQVEATFDSSITYARLIEQYQSLANTYQACDLISFGLTDSGKPLHLFLINSDGLFYAPGFQDKAIILVQNGIHAGEPCGIDASVKWATQMVENGTYPQNVVIAIIPAYNVGGMLNRGCCSRANQNGPVEHGFRGNGRLLDLNRDYIKGDSDNSAAFARLFHWLKPHVFIDTHTSNGADYQYTMTLITTRPEKLDAHVSGLVTHKLEPYIYENMDTLTPYVNVFGTTPNAGIQAFNDMPRYSTGYAALFNCIGFTTEAHMWKPFSARVNATWKMLDVITQFCEENHTEIVQNKRVADKEGPKEFESLNLEIDTNSWDTLSFLAYRAYYSQSEILGKEQLHYDRNKPEKVNIKYYNKFNRVDEVRVPTYYVIQSSWKEMINRLNENQIQMVRLDHDTLIKGVGSYIVSHNTGNSPYEGHYLHRNVVSKDSIVEMQFHDGDFIISTDQPGWRYILTTMEPKSTDSYFAWNYFDEILQQKEWYSAYIFEPYASKMLEDDPVLKMEYDAKMESDDAFASNGNLRLYWLYTKSPFYESSHNRLPILKIY